LAKADDPGRYRAGGRGEPGTSLPNLRSFGRMTSTHKHSALVSTLGSRYSALLRRYGDSPKSAQYADAATHWARFEPLTAIGIEGRDEVLDFGCGIGELLRFLRERRSFSGAYHGIDISPDVVAFARAKHPDGVFECRDIFSVPPKHEVDWVVASGVFNNRVAASDGRAFMFDALRILMPLARKGLAFNALSTYVDYFEEDLFYIDPCEVFRFCKENLSPAVALRHDYLIRPSAPPYEFTIHVHVSAQAVRSNRAT
jgi:SAM-dependent methyltransferase